jgi:hypothetical protein
VGKKGGDLKKKTNPNTNQYSVGLHPNETHNGAFPTCAMVDVSSLWPNHVCMIENQQLCTCFY